MPEPARPQMSAASDGGHARKLYSLFAKDHVAYTALGVSGAKKPDVGQVIVKESYVPEIASPSETVESDRQRHGLSGALGTTADHFDPFVREGETTYRASKVAGVYVMLRKPASTPRTDNGWIYGTLTAEGEVTSAGLVASCMGCHTRAPHERLFGPAKRGANGE